MKRNLGAMRWPTRAKAGAGLAICLAGALAAQALDLIVGPNVNVSRLPGNQSETAIAIDPTNPARLFVAAKAYSVPGIFAAYSTNQGASWVPTDPVDSAVADGKDSLPPASCDPTVAWDPFGNLYLAYTMASLNGVAVVVSTNGGRSFSPLTILAPTHDVDQATLTAGMGNAAGTVWITYRDYGFIGYPIVAQGARVSGLGMIGAFNDAEILWGSSPGNFGDIAVGPAGQVMVAYQHPPEGENQTSICVQVDPDGLGSAGFGPPVTVTTTSVGGFDYIPAQPRRSIDAEAGLAWDTNPKSAHYGRVYLVYTDEFPDESNNTDIMTRYSDDNGATWSAPVRVNDDATTNSQFLPRIAIDPTSGNVAVSWYDCRNDLGNGSAGDRDGIANDDAQIFAAVSADGGQTFSRNVQVSAGVSSSAIAKNYMDYGDYAGLAFYGGMIYPVWTDNSNSTGDNPDGATSFDIYTAPIVLGSMVTNLAASPHGTSAFITWKTLLAGTTQLAYGLTTNYGSPSWLDSSKTTNHSVWITGLQPGTRYYFQAISRIGDLAFTASNSFSTTVSNATDNPASGSVPSWWASFYFGAAVSGASDPDGDGYSNYAEFLAGTAPNDGGSRLQFRLERLNATSVKAVFSPFQGGRVYRLLSADNPGASSWSELTNAPSVTTNGEGVFVLSNATAAPRFYRLAIRMPSSEKGQAAPSPSSVLALAEALDATNLTWTTGGDAGWSGQTAVSHDGLGSAQSGVVTNGQQTWIETTVTGPGALTFWWKVSSESGFDLLEFQTNGAAQQSISGQVEWQRQTVTLWPGSQTLRWLYCKDATISEGLDMGWLDQVSFSHSDAPFITAQPLSQTLFEGDKIALNVAVSGPGPFIYQWQKNGANLSGATNSIWMTSAAAASDAGTYSVIVSNACGSAGSSNAVVAVFSSIPLGAALNAPHLSWQSGGDASWKGQTNVSWDGLHAGRSGLIDDSQQSWFETTITGPATLSFWWKVSSEEDYDYVRFSINGAQQNAISGEIDWQQVTCSLGPGSQTLRWAYTKDFEGSEGQDAAWVDQIICAPAYSNLVINASSCGWYDSSGYHNPADLSYTVGNPVQFSAGAPPLRNWFAFSIPPLSAPAVWAQLTFYTYEIDLPTNQILYQLFDVATPNAVLLGGGSGLTNVYQDLGGGIAYGQRLFSAQDGYHWITLPLNSDFLADVRAASGGSMAIGGNLALPFGSKGSLFLGSYAGSTSDIQLNLGFGPSRLSLAQPQPAGNGRWRVTVCNPDHTPINVLRLPYLGIYASSNLLSWFGLTNSLTLTNGVLVFEDAPPAGAARYYKIVEQAP